MHEKKKPALVYDLKRIERAASVVVAPSQQSTDRLVSGKVIKNINKTVNIKTFSGPLNAINDVRAIPVSMVPTDYRMRVRSSVGEAFSATR